MISPRELVRGNLTRAGAPLHSHWLATRRVTGRRPRCIHWKCLRFWDTLTLNSSTDTRYPWMLQTYLTDWIFISSVSIWAITPLCRFTIFSKNDFWIKLEFTLLRTSPCCQCDAFRRVHAWWLCHLSITRDVIRGHVIHVITIMTLNSFTEFRNIYCPEQCIFHSDRARC